MKLLTMGKQGNAADWRWPLEHEVMEVLEAMLPKMLKLVITMMKKTIGHVAVATWLQPAVATRDRFQSTIIHRTRRSRCFEGSRMLVTLIAWQLIYIRRESCNKKSQ